jgi:hypothetical protein
MVPNEVGGDNRQGTSGLPCTVPDNFRFDPQVEQVFARSGPDERRTGEEDHTAPGRLQDLRELHANHCAAEHS